MGDEIPSEYYNKKCPGCGHMNLYFRIWCFNCITRLRPTTGDDLGT